MTTVIEQNRNTLRQPMVVKCGFNETTETPTSITPSGYLADYLPLANISSTGPVPQIMDLSGEGFPNTGFSVPLETESDSGYKYGYISAAASQSDGTFATTFEVTITAANEWDYVSLELRDPDGNVTMEQYEPVWINRTCTLTIDSWTPNTRCYIVGVYLGKAWAWDNSNLIEVNLDLRSVNTEIGGELEVSTIEIKAYEPNDYTEVIGRVPDGAPIWYSAGYDGDMSTTRYFYKTDNVEWENNVLTIQGEDATSLMESKEVYAKYQSTTYADIPGDIVTRLEDMLADVTHTTVGTAPTGSNATSEILLFEDTSPRTCIADYTNLFRDDNYLRVTYVDAGIPTLHVGDSAINTWTIYADEIGELKHEIEPNINEISATVYYTTTGSSATMTVDGTTNTVQTVDFESAYVPSTVSISPSPASWTVLSPYQALMVPDETTTYTITAGTTLTTRVTAGDSPYTYNNGEKGFAYAFDENKQSFMTEWGSLTKLALKNILNRSNIVYQFTYRGNPHIQPRDVLNVQLVTWGDITEVVEELYPSDDLEPLNNLTPHQSANLYPDTDLYVDTDVYPDANYSTRRGRITEWVTMTVDSVTLEHSEGGLTSVIRARKGAV